MEGRKCRILGSKRLSERGKERKIRVRDSCERLKEGGNQSEKEGEREREGKEKGKDNQSERERENASASQILICISKTIALITFSKSTKEKKSKMISILVRLICCGGAHWSDLIF